MGFHLSFVLKNLLRHKRRTFITAISIAVGIWVYVFMDSMVQGMFYDQTVNLLEYETSTLRITTEAYWTDREFYPLDEAIDNPATILGSLSAAGIPATARTRFLGEILYYQDPFPHEGSKNIRIVAVDPLRDVDVFRIRDSLSAGEWVTPGDYGIVLGAGIADKIGAKPGYPILIRTRTRDGTYQTIDVEVRGIVDTPNPYVDLYAAFIPMDIADSALQMRGGVTDIDLYYPVKTDQNLVRAEVAEMLPEGLTVHSWDEIEPLTSELVTVANTETRVMSLLIFIIAMVGISNTMLNSVYERFREIGMLRALGMNDNQIVLSLTLEGAGIGVVGAVLGIILSIPSVWMLVKTGLDYSMFMQDMTFGFRMDPVFRGFWNPGTMIFSAIFGILVSGLIAIIPARRAVRRKIIDCLRSE